jgi:hypothetical protein
MNLSTNCFAARPAKPTLVRARLPVLSGELALSPDLAWMVAHWPTQEICSAGRDVMLALHARDITSLPQRAPASCKAGCPLCCRPRPTTRACPELARARTSGPAQHHLHSQPAHPLVASDAIPLTFSCSRWWRRSLRRRSSYRPGASWCRRSGTAGHPRCGLAAPRSAR